MRSMAMVFVGSLAISAPALVDRLEKFLPPKRGVTACFWRIYDAGHLAKHKDQTVTEIRFRNAYTVEWVEEYGEQSKHYAFQLPAQRNCDDHGMKEDGMCSEKAGGRIFCRVECNDGGLHPKPGSDQSIVLD
jgi:hypothetical protein